MSVATPCVSAWQLSNVLCDLIKAFFCAINLPLHSPYPVQRLETLLFSILHQRERKYQSFDIYLFKGYTGVFIRQVNVYDQKVEKKQDCVTVSIKRLRALRRCKHGLTSFLPWSDKVLHTNSSHRLETHKIFIKGGGGIWGWSKGMLETCGGGVYFKAVQWYEQ